MDVEKTINGLSKRMEEALNDFDICYANSLNRTIERIRLIDSYIKYVKEMVEQKKEYSYTFKDNDFYTIDVGVLYDILDEVMNERVGY